MRAPVIEFFEGIDSERGIALCVVDSADPAFVLDHPKAHISFELRSGGQYTLQGGYP